jgi:hypothetical protein
MKLSLLARRHRTAALLALATALIAAATAVAATPVAGGYYVGTTSEGKSVALRVTSNGARVRWVVHYGVTKNCQPPKYTSRSGSTYDHSVGARIHSDGSYREVLSSTSPTTFNGHSGYKVHVRAVFKGTFVSATRATGRFEQRASFYRPNGTTLATCVRRVTYRAKLK